MQTIYSKRVTDLTKELSALQAKFTYMYIARLLSFIGFVTTIALYLKDYNSVMLYLSIVLFTLFVILVQLDAKFVRKTNYLKGKLTVNRGEIDTLKGEFSNRKSGDEYSKIDPFLTADFDIVGSGSLFQFLNRTTTKLGERRFIENLCTSQLNIDIINKRQEAIKELSTKLEFVQDFQVYGAMFNEDERDLDYLYKWIDEGDKNVTKIKTLSIIIPSISVLWTILYIFNIAQLGTLVLPVVINLALVYINMNGINKSHAKLSKSINIIKKYTNLISIIESESFTSQYLKDNKLPLVNGDIQASHSIKRLHSILNLFDLNYNQFVALILNPTIGFSIQTYLKLYRWRAKNRDSVKLWFRAITEVDSIISFAVFALNSSQSVVYPQADSNTFCIDAKGLGHPLIPQNRRVNNDITISKSPAIVIITGANMAGKSTFLRSVAVNMILAMNGSPVVAKEFKFSPCDIISSIKIQDALSKNESYFYAEISRLKDIVNYSQQHEKSLIILDEILRGTNTKDKQIGSLGVLKRLISEKAIVFVATHDLIIGKLEEEYPNIAKNYCFEVELNGNELEFDYKLKGGVSKKLNASFLLKKMGLI